MSLFGKKLTEDELTQAVLFAALLCRSSERDSGSQLGVADIKGFVGVAFSKMRISPDSNELNTVNSSVSALLHEQAFIDRFLDFRLANPAAPVPSHYIPEMFAAINRSVAAYKNR